MIHLAVKMYCNLPTDHAHSPIGLNRLTIQLMFNEVSLFTFSQGIHGFDVTVPKNYLNYVTSHWNIGQFWMCFPVPIDCRKMERYLPRITFSYSGHWFVGWTEVCLVGFYTMAMTLWAWQKWHLASSATWILKNMFWTESILFCMSCSMFMID